jgi:hypothetical protein
VQRTREFVRDCVREGQETGKFRADVDADALTVIVMGTIQMLAFSTAKTRQRATQAKAVRDGLVALLQPVQRTRSKSKKRSS